MKASVNPTVTKNVETVTVSRAIFGEYFSRELASMPPVEAATIRVTTGSSHIAVIVSRECFWWVNLRCNERSVV